MSNIVTFNQPTARTRDNRFTHKDLVDKVRKIASSYGDDGVTKSVVDSFVTNGLVETYNELGYQKWVEMIHGVVQQEYVERNK